MKYLSLITSLLFIVSLNAKDINQKQFPFILPVSLEKADNSSNNYFADSDADGVHDDKDKCPATTKNAHVDLFGCIILNDDDNDGVSNKDDKCPNTEKGATVTLKGCEPDNDEDGVSDAKDNCPDTSKDFIVDSVGCPQTAILKINFKTKEFKIMDDYLPEVEEFSNFLLENEGYQAIIYGYTDSNENSKQLSRNRAKSLMNILIANGVKLTRLTAIGMGSKNPIEDNETAEGRAKNRRIEVELLQ